MHREFVAHLVPYVRPYGAKALGVIALSFAMAAVGGFQVGLVRPIFDRGLDPEASDLEIWILSGKLLALALIHVPCRFYHFYWMRFIMERATYVLRGEIFEKMQRLPMAYFHHNKRGHLVSHMVNDTRIYSQGFRAFVDLVREPLKGVVYMAMAFWFDWKLATLLVLTFPVLVLIFHVSGKRIRAHQGQVQVNHGELTHNVAEIVGAQKIVKAFNLQGFARRRFAGTQDRFFTEQMKTSFVEEMAHPFVDVVGGVALSLVIVFAHYRIQSGETTVGEFVAFITALTLFMQPVRKLSQANIELSQASAAHARIQELMGRGEEADAGRTEVAEFRDAIEIDDVTFKYGLREDNIIKGLSFTVRKGQKTALVGLSGSGKSTFFNLLLGLYPVEEGQIRIDGVPLADIRLRSLRRLFGLVSQDIFLFHDTILMNLTMGQPFSEAEVEEALEVSHAREFVDRLPDGVETVIGERGVLLSGGQQQRLTIARAFLQDTAVLLFDEATSALDNASERVVQKALDRAARDKTVITIAHRLSTIQDYDQILVLDEGRLVERGVHEELMAARGSYFKFHQMSVKG